MKYSIIIPTYNHCSDMLIPCIESIFNTTTMHNAEIIIVANGCTDNTKDYFNNLRGLPIRTFWFDDAIGFPRSTNFGLKSMSNDSEYAILLNNDCVLMPQVRNQWLNMLEDLFKSDRNMGIAGPLKLYENITKQYYIQFFLAMIKTDVIRKIGYLDEIFGDGNCEDLDYCIKAKQSGYTIGSYPVIFNNKTQITMLNFPICHHAHVTVKDVIGFDDTINRNLDIIRKRWGSIKPEKFMPETVIND